MRMRLARIPLSMVLVVIGAAAPTGLGLGQQPGEERYDLQIRPLLKGDQYQLEAVHVEGRVPIAKKPITVSPGDIVDVLVENPGGEKLIETWTVSDRYKEKVRGGKNPVYRTGPEVQNRSVNGVLGQQIVMKFVLQDTDKNLTELNITTVAHKGEKILRKCDLRLEGTASGWTKEEADRKIPLVNKPEARREHDKTKKLPQASGVWYKVAVIIRHP